MQEKTTIEIPIELKYVMLDVLKHYQAAKEKHPIFPADLVYQAAIVAEECGEMLKEVNNGNIALANHELNQTAAVSLRMLHHFEYLDK